MEPARSRGWLIELERGGRVAAGGNQVVEYLRRPEFASLPLAPPHCPGVLFWRGTIIPAADLGVLFEQTSLEDPARSSAVVLAFQDAPLKPPRYGALFTRSAPQEVFVGDDMACALPDEPGAVRFFACSCFEWKADPVPVVDPGRIFDQPLPLQPDQ